MQRKHPDQDEKLSLPKRVVSIPDIHTPISIYICGGTGVTEVDPSGTKISVCEDMLKTLTDAYEEKSDEKKAEVRRYLIDHSQQGHLARHFQLESGPLSSSHVARFHTTTKQSEFTEMASNYLETCKIDPKNKCNLFIILYRDIDENNHNYRMQHAMDTQIVLEAAGIPKQNIVPYYVKYDHIKNGNGSPINISRNLILEAIRNPIQNIINANLADTDLKGVSVEFQQERRSIVGKVVNQLQDGLSTYEKRKMADLILIPPCQKLKKKYIIKSLPKNTADAVYVRVQDAQKIFYVNRKNNTCEDITPPLADKRMLDRLEAIKGSYDKAHIDERIAMQEHIEVRKKILESTLFKFDKKLELSKQPKTLSIAGLKYITEITDHHHHSHLDALKERVHSVDEIYAAMEQAKQDIGRDKLGENDYGNVAIILNNLHGCARDKRVRISQGSCLFTFFRVDTSGLGTVLSKTIDTIDELKGQIQQKKQKALKQ